MPALSAGEKRMPFNLWCPNEGKAFRLGSGSWGLVAGRRINCPLCVSVHEAMRPTDEPPKPEFAGPSEEMEKLRHVIPVNTNGLAITSGYLGIASVIPALPDDYMESHLDVTIDFKITQE